MTSVLETLIMSDAFGSEPAEASESAPRAQRCDPAVPEPPGRMNGNALTARRAEAEEPDPYLAPALKAAAAARARTVHASWSRKASSS